MRAGFALCAIVLAAPTHGAPVPAPAPEPFSFSDIVNEVKNNIGNIVTSVISPSDITKVVKSASSKLSSIFKAVPKVAEKVAPDVAKVGEEIVPDLVDAAPEIAEVGATVGEVVVANPELLLLARRAFTADDAALDDLD